MTLIEIVQQLKNEGHKVSYSVRSDGGILVKEIDGIRYSGAKGNAIARAITGANISEARRIQLESIKPKKGQSPQSRKKDPIDTEVLKLTRKVQRKWKKSVDPKKGRITQGKVRYSISHYGKEETIAKLNQALRYAQGLAYDANIDALILQITQAMNKLGNPEALQELINKINANRNKIREEDLYPAYQELYKLNEGNLTEETIKDITNTVERILRI